MEEMMEAVETPIEEAQAKQRRAPTYFVIYKDGDIKGGLDKAATTDLIKRDDGSGHIAAVIKGHEVNFSKQQTISVTLDM